MCQLLAGDVVSPNNPNHKGVNTLSDSNIMNISSYLFLGAITLKQQHA